MLTLLRRVEASRMARLDDVRPLHGRGDSPRDRRADEEALTLNARPPDPPMHAWVGAS